jgi:nitrilase
VQAAAIAYDLPKTLVKLRTLVQEASAGGAALAVFPEAFLTAYPMHLSFAIGSRSTPFPPFPPSPGAFKRC